MVTRTVRRPRSTITRTAARWGVLDGVTTNPSLFAKVAGWESAHAGGRAAATAKPAHV